MTVTYIWGKLLCKSIQSVKSNADSKLSIFTWNHWSCPPPRGSLQAWGSESRGCWHCRWCPVPKVKSPQRAWLYWESGLEKKSDSQKMCDIKSSALLKSIWRDICNHIEINIWYIWCNKMKFILFGATCTE